MKFTALAGWTPQWKWLDGLDLWLTYLYQDSDKGVSPPDVGVLDFAIWDWPIWKRQSVSLHAEYDRDRLTLKALAYFDKYDNPHSDYDEYSLGGWLEGGWIFNPSHSIAAVVIFKKDDHIGLSGEVEQVHINEDPINGDRLSRKKETALGDMVCDSCTWYAREVLGEPVDFVYQNGGLITGAIAKGTIRVADVSRILPYEVDKLTILTLRGSAVLELFEFTSKRSHGGGSGTGAWGMVSKEIRYTLDYTGRGNSDAELQNLTFNGAPIDPNRDYRIGTNSYMYDGGDGYWMFLVNGTNIRQTGRPMGDILIDYIYAQDLPLVPTTDGRVTLIGGAVQ
jgi:hypothetical protein